MSATLVRVRIPKKDGHEERTYSVRDMSDETFASFEVWNESTLPRPMLVAGHGTREEAMAFFDYLSAEIIETVEI